MTENGVARLDGLPGNVTTVLSAFLASARDTLSADLVSARRHAATSTSAKRARGAAERTDGGPIGSVSEVVDRRQTSRPAAPVS